MCVVAGVVVGLALLVANRSVPAELLHPEVQAEAWNRYRTTLEAAPTPDRNSAPVKGLLDAFVAMNRAEVEAARPGTTAPPTTEAVLAWETAARDFAQEFGPEAFLAVGRRVALDFGDRFEAWLRLCAEQKVNPELAVLDVPRSEVADAYVDLGGLFVQFAARGGLVDTQGLVAARRPLLHAVFLHHWARALQGRFTISSWLTPEETEWTLRWRAEWQSEGAPERRIEAALALKAVAGYPASYNAGVLALGANRHAEAARYLRDAPEPEAAPLLRQAERAAAESGR